MKSTLGGLACSVLSTVVVAGLVVSVPAHAAETKPALPGIIEIPAAMADGSAAETHRIDVEPLANGQVLGARIPVCGSCTPARVGPLPAGDYRVTYTAKNALPHTFDSVRVNAGKTTQTAPVSATRLGSVSGTVSTSSGEPASGALVTAIALGDKDGTTEVADSNGRYAIDDLPAGDYELRIATRAHPNVFDFRVTDTASGPAGSTVEVVNGRETRGIDARLSYTGVVAGTIQGPDDRPMDWVDVRFYEQINGQWSQSRRVSTASLLSDGTLSVEGVPAGVYRVGFFPIPSHKLTDGSPEYYPGSTTLDGAQNLTVSKGQRTTINRRLEPGGSIRGTLNAADGTPASQARVTVTSTTNPSRGSYAATTDTRGQFEVRGLGSDTYQIAVTKSETEHPQGIHPTSPARTASVVVGEPTDLGSVSLVKHAVVTGTILTAQGTPPHSSVEVGAYDENGRRVSSTSTNSTGRYRFNQLYEGKYTFKVFPHRFQKDVIEFTTSVDLGQVITRDFTLAGDPKLAPTVLPAIAAQPKVGAQIDVFTGAWQADRARVSFTWRIVGGSSTAAQQPQQAGGKYVIPAEAAGKRIYAVVTARLGKETYT